MYGRVSILWTLMLLTVGLVPDSAQACPFCFGSQQLTLRERIENPDASVLVKWQAGEPGNLDTQVPPSTQFEVLQVWQGDLQPGDSFSTDHYYEGRSGDQFLLVGNRLDEQIRWDRAIPLSLAGLEYVRGLPTSQASADERLKYAFAHLETPDTTIANDAFNMLAASKYEDISAAKAHLSAKNLREWVHSSETQPMRLGVYGMLLGLAGSPDDVRGLHRKIFTLDPDQPIRLGIDGVMGGYLLLAGADGLAQLEEAFLQNSQVHETDLSAVLSALRFIWEFGDGVVSKDRLRRSLRLALHHESTRELAIADLARWQDWSVTSDLIALYERDSDDDYTRRAVIRFLMVAAEVDTTGLSTQERAAVRRAAEVLESIKAASPAEYKRAARGFLPGSVSQSGRDCGSARNIVWGC